jgi:hypothetical protein
MKIKKTKAEKRPARNAINIDIGEKLLTEMDSDEILSAYGYSVAGGERKSKPKMRVSGKSVFVIKKIIEKKYKRK